MHFRCPACQAASWADEVVSGGELSCVSCEATFKLGELDLLQEDPAALFRRARRLYKTRGYDIPTAYSVLMGLMMESRLKRPHRSSERVRRNTANDAADPVEAKPEAKDQEGDPVKLEARIDRLVERNRLSRSVARQVALGEITLSAAMLTRETDLLGTKNETKKKLSSFMQQFPWSWALGAIAVLILLIRVAGAFHDPQAETAEQPASRDAPQGTEIVRDSEGQPISIVGPDPQSVLIAFCQTSAAPGARVPVEIVLDQSTEAGRRIGVFREVGTAQPRSITIRRERNARRWVSGNGKARILPQPLPDIPPDTARFPISASAG